MRSRTVTAGVAAIAVPICLTAGISAAPGWPNPFSYQYLLSTAIIATVGGLLPGTIATILSAVAVGFVWKAQTGLGLLLFVTSGLSISYLAELALRRIDELGDANAALTASERRYRAFFENLHEVVTVWVAVRDDSGEVCDFLLRDRNPAAARLFPTPPGPYLGQRYSEIVGPVRTAERVPLFARVLETGEPRRYEVTHREVQLAVSAFRIDDNTLGIVGIDVTVRKRYEDALVAANRQKDEFLANLGHELRTPVNVVMWWSDLLERQQVGTDRIQPAATIIKRNAQVQHRLVEDLLDVQRISSGRMDLEIGDVDLEPLVHRVVEAQAPLAREKGLELRVSAQPVSIPGDAHRIQQVLGNLLNNAIKFTDSGVVCLVVSRADDDGVRIVVRDTGIGIDPSFLPHVWERFRQADGTTTRAYGGLGLGLAIVKHIVELHGGRVQGCSDGPGTGSTFEVLLPGRQNAAEAVG